jgi:hypothetical protein
MSTILYSHCDITGPILTELPMLRSWGFDVVAELGIEPALQGTGAIAYGAAASTDAEILAYMDAAQAAGLKVALPALWWAQRQYQHLYDEWPDGTTAGTIGTDALTHLATLCGDHPAFWGWYACDEGDTHQYPSSVRQQVYTLLKTLTPSGVVFESEYTNTYGTYTATGAHDVFVPDLYPWETGMTLSQGLNRLKTQTGGVGSAAGTDSWAALGVDVNNGDQFSWFLDAYQGAGDTCWPPTGALAAEVAQLSAAGWLNSPHIFVFAYVHDPYDYALARSDVPSYLIPEMTAAIAPYSDEPPSTDSLSTYYRSSSAWHNCAVKFRVNGAWADCAVKFRSGGEWT